MSTKTNNPSAAMAAPEEASDQVRRGAAVLMDVRGFDEFAAGHAQGTTCLPLPDLKRRAGELPTDRPVLVMCQSGGRSALAAARLRALGMDNVTDVQDAWRRAGLPIERQASAIPLEPQVWIAAGALVLGLCLAGFFAGSAFFYRAALIGFLLTLMGALGICPMMSALELLSWNQP